ncbi:unnamed protein product, partial [Lymnaea stagnalis]
MNTRHTSLISGDVLQLLNFINQATLGTCLACIGVIGNLINLIVFFKQGVSESINISLVALTVSDLGSLLTVQWINLLCNPAFTSSGVPIVRTDIFFLTAGTPHGLFARVTSWVTAYITIERCLCVVIPLKVKFVVSPKLTLRVMLVIYVVMMLTLLPTYATVYMTWNWYPDVNRTLLGLTLAGGSDVTIFVTYALSASTQITSFLIVVIFTLILITNIRRNSKWRLSSVVFSLDSANEHSKKRDSKTLKMVTMMAAIYIVCFSPMMMMYIAISSVSGFSANGPYQNDYFAAWSFADLLDSLNSSASFFVYYVMSTKYRKTFKEFFRRR